MLARGYEVERLGRAVSLWIRLTLRRSLSHAREHFRSVIIFEIGSLMLDELKTLDTSERALKRFALQTTVIALALAALLGFGFDWRVVPLVLVGLSAVLVVGLFISRALLRAVFIGWMALAFVIGTVVSWVILTGLFYLVITPLGRIARLFGKQFLDRSWHAGSDSFWHWRTERTFSKETYERQY